MRETQSELGDVVLEVLEVCFSADHRAKLEAAAEERNITVGQLVAAAVAQRVSESFEVRPKARRGALR